MPKTKQQKIDIVTDLKDRVSKSKSIVFADYKGMTMSQLSAIRNQLGELSAEFSVTKNNLVKIALKENGYEFDDAVFEGPVATLFSYGDEIAGIKVLAKAIKDYGIGKTKAGFLDREPLSEAQITQLAQLPGRDELRAKVVGALGAPLYGIVGVLQANLRNLVYALDAVRKQKGGE